MPPSLSLCPSRKSSLAAWTITSCAAVLHEEAVPGPERLRRMLAEEDTLLYEVYEIKRPEVAGELLLGISIVHPGKVGAEFFMTKGHFHSVLETAEVYYCLKGEGFMVMETPEGETCVEALLRPARCSMCRRAGRTARCAPTAGRPGDLLRLPRQCRARLRHHRSAGLPQAGAGRRAGNRDRGQPALAAVRRPKMNLKELPRAGHAHLLRAKNDPRLRTELERPGRRGDLQPDRQAALLRRGRCACCPGVDGYIAGLDAIDRAALAAADRLKVIARYGVGVDSVDLQAAHEKVSSSPTRRRQLGLGGRAGGRR